MTSSGEQTRSRALRALIVDDEPLARVRIRSLLETDPDITVIGECANGEDAVAAIQANGPDLVFLDIQMPDIDGFDVVEAVGVKAMPAVIFVTAYDEYALKAFDVLALDYLLKPVDRDRFAQALARAKARFPSGKSPAPQQDLQALVDQLAQRQRRDLRIAIKTDGKVIFVRTADIDWIEAVDNYARLHMGPTTHVVRDTLARLEQRLPAVRFLRIQRSTIVNVDRVRAMEPWEQGDYVFIMNDGTRLTSGRRYRPQVQAFVHAAM